MMNTETERNDLKELLPVREHALSALVKENENLKCLCIEYFQNLFIG